MGLPLQQVLRLLPLGDLSSTVIVVLLPRGADVFCPVICWVLVQRDNAEMLEMAGGNYNKLMSTTKKGVG